MPSRRFVLLLSLSGVMAVVACGSFGSAPSPVETPDGGTDGAAPTPDASFDAGGSDSSVPPAPECATPLVTDPNATADCAGSPGKVYLASDSRNCGRCGYSCDAEPCVNGLCAERKETVQVERLLGNTADMAIVSTSTEILGFGRNVPKTPLATLATETPMSAVYTDGILYWRTNDRLRTSQGVDLTVAGGAPFLAPSPVGVLTSANDKIVEVKATGSSKDLVAQLPSPREIVPVAGDYVVYSIPTGGPASLRLVPAAGPNATQLVGDVGALTALQAFGTYVYFARGNQVLRVAKTGGTPEVVAKTTNAIKAYLGGPALAVTADAIRFLATGDGTNFELYEQEQCPGAQPRVVATPQNAKGVIVASDRVYWITASNQLYSRAIAKKN